MDKTIVPVIFVSPFKDSHEIQNFYKSVKSNSKIYYFLTSSFINSKNFSSLVTLEISSCYLVPFKIDSLNASSALFFGFLFLIFGFLLLFL